MVAHVYWSGRCGLLGLMLSSLMACVSVSPAPIPVGGTVRSEACEPGHEVPRWVAGRRAAPADYVGAAYEAPTYTEGERLAYQEAMLQAARTLGMVQVMETETARTQDEVSFRDALKGAPFALRGWVVETFCVRRMVLRRPAIDALGFYSPARLGVVYDVWVLVRVR